MGGRPLVFIFNEAVPGKTKMHTKQLELNDWVKIDKSYPSQMRLKKELIKKYRKNVFVSNYDDSAVACKWELFDKLVKYLPERFPDIFELRPGYIFNKVLNESIPTGRDGGEDPLLRAAALTQEDWVIIEWDDDEQGYVLTSGVVYFPMRWSLQSKFNKGIAGIHMPVKPFMKHLATHVYDVFKKMSPEKSLWRANWAIFNDLDGPLDLHTPTGSLDRNDLNATTKFEGDKTGKILTFRAEYQTLVKLPETKCIVFGIRTYQRYLEEFKHFPISDCEGLIKAIETLDGDFVIYKGASFWKDAAVKYLRYAIESRTQKPGKSDIRFSWFPLAAVVLSGALVTGFFINRMITGTH